MDEDRLRGTAKSFGGKVEEGFGRATGDMKSQVQGKATDFEGRAQDLYGQAKDTAAETFEALRQRAGQTRRLHTDDHRAAAYTTAAVCLGIRIFHRRHDAPETARRSMSAQIRLCTTGAGSGDAEGLHLK
jgi:uncharacterized protein YjbJ (UPF0337 family)